MSRKVRRRVIRCLSVVWLALFAAPAFACTVPTAPIYDPTQRPSDLIIDGVATATGTLGTEPFADIRVSNVYVGNYSLGTYRLTWWNYDGGGMCAPPGPHVAQRQRVRIYLRQVNDELEPQGWVLADESPKTRQLIQYEQTVAQQRLKRQDTYFNVGGALSYNDPRGWLKIKDILEYRQSIGMALVSFSVSPNGVMDNCTRLSP